MSDLVTPEQGLTIQLFQSGRPQSRTAVGFCLRRKVPGKIHPSREFAGGAVDTRVGDRDGPDVLPDSADGAGWLSDVVVGVFATDRGSCSSAALGHSGDRSRKPGGSR